MVNGFWLLVTKVAAVCCLKPVSASSIRRPVAFPDGEP